ncbi:MAG TPA: ATP-binding protein [Chthoniobacteraceae bacterium]|nr:ATP-binding protein [Chthoniobacteraceae bacterium]
MDSLRVRLMLLAALALLPLAGLVFYNAVTQRHEAADAAEADALRLARVCANNEERALDSANRLLALMADIPVVKQLDTAACQPLFSRVLGNEPGYENLGLLDARGNVLVSANAAEPRRAMGGRAFFTEILRRDEFEASDFEIDPGTRRAEMVCGEPVSGGDGKIEGVLYAELDLAWMSNLGRRLDLPPAIAISVLSPDGIVLMRTADAAQYVGKIAPEGAAGRAIVEGRGVGIVHQEGSDHIRRLFAFAPLDTAHRLHDIVSTGIPDEMAFRSARESEHRQFFILGIFALAALAGAWLAADILVLRGVRRLLDATQQVASGDLATRAGRVHGGVEFRELAGAFDAMAASLQQQSRERDAAERELERRVEERTAELAALNTRLDLALRGTNDGIWDWDLVTNHVYYSPRWKEMLGCGEAEIGDTFREWETRIHPLDHSRALVAMHEYLAGKRPAFELEYRLRHREGTYRWILSRGVAVRDGSGAPVRMAGSNVDFTERRQAEQALRESESKLRAFITNVPAILFSIDHSGIITMAEGRGTNVLRFFEGGIVGRSVAELYGDVPGVVESVKRALTGESFSTTMHIRELHFEVAYSPARAPDGSVAGVIGVAYDITERFRAKEELERAAAELRRSNEELEQFAYIASHDLQEPLRMVASYTQLLERRYAAQLDDTAREFIAYAVDGAKRMQQFIAGLLHYSRVGTEPRIMEEVNLDEVLDAALENLRMAIAESGALIERQGLPRVKGDARQLAQLFQNLVGNALKFRKPGQPPHIQITAGPAGDFWQISVRDNGIGLNPQFSGRVFIIFQRLHTREEYEGTGLGLAICKKIVERHGGRIWVESKEGEGATFSFTLPAALPHETVSS